MLNELSKRIPTDCSEEVIFDLYIQEYEQVVNRMFSATIFYRGMDYACSMYKHIVKVEYRRFCVLLIKKVADEPIREQILLSMRKKRNQLLRTAPSTSEKTAGFEIFYSLTGGFRKKYKQDRKAVGQMYDELVSTSKVRLYPIYFWRQKLLRFSSYIRNHLLWELRSCIKQ